MRLLSILVLAAASTADQEKRGTFVFKQFVVQAHEVDRRWVLAEGTVEEAAVGPFRVFEAITDKEVHSQIDGRKIRWLVPFIAAKDKPRFDLRKGPATSPALSLADGPEGSISIKASDREITRYYATTGKANKKPCFYPLMAHGVNVLRCYPFEDRAGEAKDHPHQTGVYHAFGDVNGHEYWSKTDITNKRILKKEAGPAYARIIAENHWGEDLVEVQDIAILNVGADAIMDWTITWTAANGPVVLGKNQKMAKEGSFGVRVATELTRKGDAPDMMVDALGNKGEKAIRATNAPWVDYTGDFAGKKVGVSVMNHPSSFRYPGTWHVRAYGLFAANPWYFSEAKTVSWKEHTIAKGESLVLKYRVYVHTGDAQEGKVADVFAGYSHAAIAPE